MKIYHYDQSTGEYLGSSDTDIDPVSQQPMIPAWATATAPPTLSVNQRALWINGAWSTVTTGLLCYYNNGLSSKIVDSTYVPQVGEVIFATTPTVTELTSSFTDYTSITKQQSITALNQTAAAKITAKEKYYAAVVTSSLYTDTEITTIVAQIKADKLAIYNDLKAKQEAIING
jgi:hypothetical protein